MQGQEVLEMFFQNCKNVFLTEKRTFVLLSVFRIVDQVQTENFFVTFCNDSCQDRDKQKKACSELNQASVED